LWARKLKRSARVELAKPRVDIGLSTNDLTPMLAFWQGEADIPFDHLLPIRKGHDQHRHDALGSVLKINHHAEPLPEAAPSGYRELIVARPEERPGVFRAGESLIFLDESPDAPPILLSSADLRSDRDAGLRGRGWRYITFQVFKVDAEHARVLAAGGREALAPLTLGATARISMVRDPDGNWIELSQRASITGSLD
jgi:lactoylglutathione lyase